LLYISTWSTDYHCHNYISNK